MLAAVASFTILDAILKFLVQRHDPVFLAWGRNLFQVLYLVALMPVLGAERMLRTHRLGLHILRGFLLVTTTVLIVMALKYLPMAQTYAITFSTPLFATILATFVLGEKSSRMRWMMIVCGFVGVLIALQPGALGAGPQLLFPLGMAVGNAVFHVATRHGQGEDPLAMLFYVGLFALAFVSPALPWTWSGLSAPEWGILAVGGLFGTLGHVCLIAAFRLAPTAIVSPMIYAQIIYAGAIGYFVFGEEPTAATIAGAAVVAACGIGLMRLKS